MKRYDNLVIYHKQLGDVLLLQPALAALAKRGSVALATRATFVDLLSLMSGPVYPAPEWLPRARQLYCLETRPGATIYAAQALTARRILLLTRSDVNWWQSLIFSELRVVPGGDTYRAAWFHAALGGKTEEFLPPSLNKPPPEWLPAGLPSEYGVIHPTSAWKRKTWAPERWVDALLGMGDSLCWVVTSGPSPWEVELAGKLAMGMGERAINMAGRTTMRQYLALLSGARLTLSVDGSASHISAAFGKPTLTLFGPTNPVHWHFPSATTVRLWAADFVGESKPPVDAIPVQAVRAAAARLLELAHV